MKTGAWLRGGRGKIAGMVAQKSSDGKGTVLRELVVPKNPQTVDQMATRLAFGTITQAAGLMLPIIGQTFKGQGDEKMNRRRFVALNVPGLKELAVKQNEGETNAGSFRGKSSTAIIPNPYIISEGSLVTPADLVPFIIEGGNQIDSKNLGGVVPLVVGTSYNPANLLASIFSVQVKQQITMLGLFTESSENVNYTMSGGADFVRNCNYRAYRINFNPNAPEFVFTNDMTTEQLGAALRLGFDSDKTSVKFIDAFIQIVSKRNDGIELDDYSLVDVFSDGVEGYELAAFGIILSQLVNGVWDYNNTTMLTAVKTGNVEVSNEYWYGLTFNNALTDYLGAEAASKLYTRKGGLINDI